MLRYFGMALGLSVAMLSAAGLQAKTLDCSFAPGSDTQGWIAKRVIFTWDEKAGTAKVDDEIIEFFLKAPIAAKVTHPTDKQVAFSWLVQTKDSGGQYAKQTYYTSYYPADNSAVISSKPVGYINTYGAQGTCKVK